MLAHDVNLVSEAPGEGRATTAMQKGGHSKLRLGVFSQVTSDRTREKGLRFCQERFLLDSRKILFMEKLILSTGAGCLGK